MIALADSQSFRRSNLAFALHCLPWNRRHHALTFYRFCRAVDDLADDPCMEERAKRDALNTWRNALRTGVGLPEELMSTLEECELETRLLVEIVNGCEMDISPPVYETMDELLGYCWKVACAVGLVSIEIFGCRHPDSARYAEELGYALQLTNILRDVGEDAAMGRVYLPSDLLALHGTDRNSVLLGLPDRRIQSALKDFASRARSRFLSAATALPPEDHPQLLAPRIMAAIYSQLLAQLEISGYDVFNRRIQVSKPKKMFLFLSTWVTGK